MSTHVKSACTEAFPEVEFTGGSQIHASVAKGQQVAAAAPKVFKALLEKKFALDIYRHLNQQFGAKIEWMLSEKQFEDRAYVDFWNHSKGLGDTQEDTKLRNPFTGNVFHRVALVPSLGMVCGVRFWCDPDSEQETDLGFRFRIEMLAEDEADLRLRVTEQATADAETMVEIEHELATKPWVFAPEEATSVTIREIESL